MPACDWLMRLEDLLGCFRSAARRGRAVLARWKVSVSKLHKMTEFDDENKGIKPASYERIVLKNASEYHYLKIHLEFEEADVSLNPVEFKQLIISALKRLHGEVGAALPVDVLTYEEKTLTAILRVSNAGLVKLWSALTLLGSYQNTKCAFRVIQSSPFLLALAGNSREMLLD